MFQNFACWNFTQNAKRLDAKLVERKLPVQKQSWNKFSSLRKL